MLLKKIDMHVHCIEERGIPKLSGHFYPTVKELRKIYDKIGVEKGVLLPPGTCPEFTTERLSPREAKRIAEKYNNTIGWWFCGIDPRFGNNNPQTDFSHYLNYYKSQGAKGVSELIPNIPLDDPRMLNLFSHCEKCGMSVTLHFGKPKNDYGVVDELGLPKLEKVLKMFPELKVIGHSVRFWSELDADVTEETRDSYPAGKVAREGRVGELMRKYSNLYCDLSSLSGYRAMTRDPDYTYKFMEEFADKIFYATDIHDPENINPQNPAYDMLKLSEFLDNAYLDGKISFETYEKICRKNALKLLGECEE